MTCSSARRTDQPPRRALSRLASVIRWTAETSSAREAVISAVTASRSDWRVLVMVLGAVPLERFVEGAGAVAGEVQRDVEVAQRFQAFGHFLPLTEKQLHPRVVRLDAGGRVAGGEHLVADAELPKAEAAQVGLGALDAAKRLDG